MNNQKQIVTAAELFAVGNDGKYPPSVSYLAYGTGWNWSDPRTLISSNTTPLRPHRAMSEYLGSYIENADVMVCSKAPEKFRHLQMAWDAGDKWDNPDTPFNVVELRGSYCFYWNYTGFLEGGRLFKGPCGPSDGRGNSSLMMSCYFGYGRGGASLYGSCEKLKNPSIIPKNASTESTWWSCGKSEYASLDSIRIKLHAAYTDGHVECYTPSETVPMKVIAVRGLNTPFADGVGYTPGDFYIPKKALH